MDYRFREIRKGECGDVMAFASTNGATLDRAALRHHLSLVAWKGQEIVAAALCVEQPKHFVVEIVHGEGVEQALITELADRCFRKVQSEDICSVRINSPAQSATQTIWQSANWLDQIQETPPPSPASEEPCEDIEADAAEDKAETSQAA